MHPASSLIFFTTVSGLGFGLAAWVVLGLLDLSNLFNLIAVSVFTFGLIGSGLLSSTLHLGHPERAWRALSQWRSSWLSREGVLSVLVLITLSGWFLYSLMYGSPPQWVGFLIIILILATVYATAMIYASLKTVLCWYNPLTPFCYLMFAASGGLLANLFLMSIFGQYTSPSIYYFLLFLILSTWLVKFAWWRNLDTDISKSNLSTATGLGSFGEIRSLMPPHTSENYLQKEMGFVIARRHAIKLRFISVVLGGIIPLIIIIPGTLSSVLLGFALVSHLIGVFIERWLFFAEAKHIVSLYYGKSI